MQLSDLISEVRQEAQGAPDFTILDALQRAAHEFMQKSGVWTETLEPVALAAGVREYDVSVPSGARVMRLIKASVNGSRIDVKSESDLFGLSAGATGRPSVVAQYAAQSAVLVWPTPVTIGTLVVEAALMPTREAGSVPDDVGEAWREGIIAGAKARLLKVRKREWTDPQRAGELDNDFEYHIGCARRQAIGGRMASDRTVQMRPWV